jgi:uncharacterized protein YacL
MKITKTKKLVFRIAGLLLGIFCLIFGIFLIAYPVFETKLEFINAVCGILIGIVFIFYGVTGRRHVFTKNNYEADV